MSSILEFLLDLNLFKKAKIGYQPTFSVKLTLEILLYANKYLKYYFNTTDSMISYFNYDIQI